MRGILLATALALAGVPASAQTLRIAFKAAVDAADPHLTFTPNRNVGIHVWETLLTQDEHLRPQPGLAESWRSIDPLTWEFRLREGVTFSDGSPLTSEDAAFSIRRAQAATGPRTYASAVRNIVAVETPDPRTLIVRTGSPTPLQPDFLVAIAIVSARASVDASDADFNGGRASMGSGPYRWIRWTPAQDVVLDRNPAWRGPAEPWERVIFRFIPNDSTRVAALLAGDVDVIDTIPAGLYARVRDNPQTRLVTGDSIFTHYFFLDSMSPRIANATGADGQPLPQNPLRDHRVREAMTHAINRTALAERTMEGGATATGQVAPDGLIGHVPDLAVPRYDPALSRRLMAEAGYGQGFNLNLHCTLDRFAGDARTCQAIGQMLTTIGIRTTVEAMPMPVYLRRSANLNADGTPELSAMLSIFGSSSGLASEGLTSLVRTVNGQRAHGGWNRTRYSSPELDGLLERTDSLFDPVAREAAMRQAVRYTVDQEALLPIFHMKASWGLRRPLTLTPRADQYTMATEVRPAP